MAFFQDFNNSGLVRDMWPYKDIALTMDETANTVSTNLTDLCNDLDVVPKVVLTNRTRPWDVIWRPFEENDTLEIAHFRIQGHLKAFSLARLGNWSGNEKDACRATQNLTLGGNGHIQPWIETIKNINVLRSFVLSAAGSGGHRSPEQSLPEAGETTINFHKLVFLKAIQSSTATTLTSIEDPNGIAASISHLWVPNAAVRFGIRTSQGGIRPANYRVFQEGDFVDVAFTVDIANLRRGLVVNFELEHVVKLISYENIAENLDVAAPASSQPRTESRALGATLVYDE